MGKKWHDPGLNYLTRCLRSNFGFFASNTLLFFISPQLSLILDLSALSANTGQALYAPFMCSSCNYCQDLELYPQQGGYLTVKEWGARISRFSPLTSLSYLINDVPVGIIYLPSPHSLTRKKEKWRDIILPCLNDGGDIRFLGDVIKIHNNQKASIKKILGTCMILWEGGMTLHGAWYATLLDFNTQISDRAKFHYQRNRRGNCL